MDDRILKYLKDNKNILITGQAGTGKSSNLKYIKEWAKENNRNIAITASSGISALNLNLGATTFHSFMKMQLGDKPIEEYIKFTRFNKKQSKMLKELTDLVIEEFFMLNPDFFEKASKLIGIIRNLPDIPFGGVRIILVGDLLQLPSVKCDKYIFETETWKDLNLQPVILKTIYRQTDVGFQKILSNLRIANLGEEEIKFLKSRCIKYEGDNIIKLFPKKDQTAEYNKYRMNKLEGELITFKGKFSVDNCTLSKDKQKEKLVTLFKDCLATPTIELKVGCVVIHLVNKPEDNIFNGSKGIVESFQDGFPLVKFDDKKILIKNYTWTVETKTEGIFYYSQIPLLAAWAINIHKSQGLSLDCPVEIDLSSNIFEYSQAYVAISRITKAENVYISNFNKDSFFVDDKVIKFYEGLKE